MARALTCWAATLLPLLALGCDPQPMRASTGVIDLGFVSGKTDALLDVELPELPVGGATVVRVTTSDALALTLHRISGGTAQLSVISRDAEGTRLSESAETSEPMHTLAGSTEDTEHEITIHNRGAEPYRGRLQVELDPSAVPEVEPPSDDPDTPDVAQVVVAGDDELVDGSFDVALASALATHGNLAAFDYHGKSATVQSVLLLEKSGEYQVLAGKGSSLLVEIAERLGEGWEPHTFDHADVLFGDPAILWLRKDDVLRSYISGIDEVRNRANTMRAQGWEVVEILQRGHDAPMVAWLVRNDGKIEVEHSATIDPVEDELPDYLGEDFSVYRLRYGGTENSVAWLSKGTEYVALVADDPASLREDLRTHIADHWVIESLSYAGPGSIVWLTKDTDVDFVLAPDAPDLDAPLDPYVADGWTIHTFIHRGDTKAAAIVTE